MTDSSITSKFVFTIMMGTLLSGALNNIALKQQDEFTTGSDQQKWNHPILQTFIMFVAEFLCLCAFYLLFNFNTEFKADYGRQLEDAKKKGLRTEVHWLIPYIPACCDICGSTLQFLSLTLIDQSIYVMLRGGVPVITAILSIMFLGRKLYGHHYLGLGLAVSGISIVGISQFVGSSGGSSNVVIGLLCVIVSLCTTGVQFIIEDKILNTFYILPLKMVGMEGTWGLMLSAGAILVTSLMSCDYTVGAALCQPNGYVEDPVEGFKVLLTNWQMLCYAALGITSLSFFNFCGVSVTKYVSSLSRSILNISVTVIIWFFDMIAGYESFNWLQLVGFIVLVSGNLIYQEVIVIPGFDKNIKKNLARLSLVGDNKEKFEESVRSKDMERDNDSGRDSETKY